MFVFVYFVMEICVLFVDLFEIIVVCVGIVLFVIDV